MMYRKAYYFFKPFIPWSLRMVLRRIRARRLRRLAKSSWPISEDSATIPTRWPGWPDGKKFAFVLTHDVEGPIGLERCRALVEMEMRLGVRSSFNFVPEGEYAVPESLRAFLFENGFEVGVHDLHHDGSLYDSHESFERQAQRINQYLQSWGAVGFRSGFMFHNMQWLQQLNVLYDASTFDVDPFEPQNDAVNTIFPFWISGEGSKGYVELPYTMAQDSTLFILFKEVNIDIWVRKLDWVAARGGMALVNVHPDYMCFDGKSSSAEYSADFYEGLLRYVADRYKDTCWFALPREVAGFAAQFKPTLRHETIHVPSTTSPILSQAGSITDIALPQRKSLAPSEPADCDGEPKANHGLRVITVDLQRDSRWEHFVSSHPDGIIYQHPGWIRALEQEYGRECISLACVDEEGRFRGILPLMTTAGMPWGLGGYRTGRRLSSLPRTPVSGLLTIQPEASEILINAAIERAGADASLLLELKPYMPIENITDRITRLPWRETFIIELPSDSAKIRFGDARNHSRIRWSINKATKEGVQVRIAEHEDDLRAWYRLYRSTMCLNAVPPRSCRFFVALWRQLHPIGLLHLFLAEQGGATQNSLLAGSIMLSYGRTAFYAFNGCRPEAFSLRPNDIIQWHAIHHAAKQGFRWYDMGEVPGNRPQLAEYKRKWGTTPRRLYRYYYPQVTDQKVETSRRNLLGVATDAIWKCLPMNVAGKLADKLYSRL